MRYFDEKINVLSEWPEEVKEKWVSNESYAKLETE